MEVWGTVVVVLFGLLLFAWLLYLEHLYDQESMRLDLQKKLLNIYQNELAAGRTPPVDLAEILAEFDASKTKGQKK